jgi:hypothetical protein
MGVRKVRRGIGLEEEWSFAYDQQKHKKVIAGVVKAIGWCSWCCV